MIMASAALFSAGWQVNGWRMGAKLDDLRMEHQSLVTSALVRRQEVDRAYRRLEREAQEKSEAYALAAEERRQRIEAQNQQVTTEVIRYATTPVPRFRADAEWVRIHDAARNSDRAGEVSVSAYDPERVDDSAATVGAAEALLVVTGNYQKCGQCRDRLVDLQGWVAEFCQ